MKIEFFVPGIPATAGSKKPFIYRSKKDGKQRVAMAPDNKRQKPWMAVVRTFAAEAYQGDPLTGPIILTLQFGLPRPKSHYRSGKYSGLLKDSAPKAIDHIVKPDLTKLVRAAEDALKGVLWIDDSQVATQFPRKFYSDKPGVLIVVEGK